VFCEEGSPSKKRRKQFVCAEFGLDNAHRYGKLGQIPGSTIIAHKTNRSGFIVNFFVQNKHWRRVLVSRGEELFLSEKEKVHQL
jgi:hypothetical protein